MPTTKKPRNADYVRQVNVPGPRDEVLQAQFQELLSPAIYAQSAYYRNLKLRDRILDIIGNKVPRTFFLESYLHPIQVRGTFDSIWLLQIMSNELALDCRYLGDALVTNTISLRTDKNAKPRRCSLDETSQSFTTGFEQTVIDLSSRSITAGTILALAKTAGTLASQKHPVTRISGMRIDKL